MLLRWWWLTAFSAWATDGLVDGTPRDVDVPRGARVMLTVDVPEGATQAGVAVLGEGDPALAVRVLGSGIGLPTRFADGIGVSEALVWGIEGNPPVVPGRWNIEVSRAGKSKDPLRVVFSTDAEDVQSFWDGRRSSLLSHGESDVTGAMVHGMATTVVVPADPGYTTVVVEVPRRAGAMTLDLPYAQPGIELHTLHGSIIGDYDENGVVSATSKRDVERIVLTPDTAPGGWAGEWYVDLFNPLSEDLVADLRVVMEDLGPLAPWQEKTTRLVPGEVAEVQVEGPAERHAPFVLDVPEGTSEVHLQLMGATADYDLYASAGQPMASWSDATWYSNAVRGNESLVIQGEELSSGPLYVDAVVASKSEPPSRVKLLATLDGPAGLDHPALKLPDLTPDVDGSTLEKLVHSTVRVVAGESYGSGVIVRPDGYVLTVHHVVEREDGSEILGSEVILSLPMRPDEPPVELFTAEVIGEDETLDLALLRVTGDVYGRPLPEGYVFPYTAMGDAAELRLGQTLWVAGYPSVASKRSVPTFTLTRGIAGGFELGDDGLREWIKTDARMNSGASGGPVVDEQGVLFGLVNESIWNDDDVMWFSRPVSRVPEAWWPEPVEDAPEAEAPPSP